MDGIRGLGDSQNRHEKKLKSSGKNTIYSIWLERCLAARRGISTTDFHSAETPAGALSLSSATAYPQQHRSCFASTNNGFHGASHGDPDPGQRPQSLRATINLAFRLRRQSDNAQGSSTSSNWSFKFAVRMGNTNKQHQAVTSSTAPGPGPLRTANQMQAVRTVNREKVIQPGPPTRTG